MMKTVTIYTDGACPGNPGPGGWGAILMYGPHTRELSGGEAATTNNRMELTAVIEALSLLKDPASWSCVRLQICDRWAGEGLGQSAGRLGAEKADQEARPESDLWDRRLALTEVHSIRYHWVRAMRGECVQQPL